MVFYSKRYYPKVYYYYYTADDNSYVDDDDADVIVTFSPIVYKGDDHNDDAIYAHTRKIHWETEYLI